MKDEKKQIAGVVTEVGVNFLELKTTKVITGVSYNRSKNQLYQGLSIFASSLIAIKKIQLTKESTR